MLTHERLREVLHYDAETGIFTWRITASARARAGCAAGKGDPNGYVRIGFEGRYYLAHRLAWLYTTGELPKLDLDHKDGVRANNRWDNLREANRSQNCQNRKRDRRGTSGLKGAAWSSRHQKWGASITIDKKQKYLGYFDTPEEAHAVYVAAATERYGEFARSA